MRENYKLSDIEWQQITSKLPPDIIAFADQYPIDVLNASEFWDIPPLPNNYIPRIIEIYYADTDSPDIFIKDGQLEDYVIRETEENYNLVAVMLDYEWTYIQIEGRVILNRLGGVILPSVILNPATLINSVLRKLNYD